MQPFIPAAFNLLNALFLCICWCIYCFYAVTCWLYNYLALGDNKNALNLESLAPNDARWNCSHPGYYGLVGKKWTRRLQIERVIKTVLRTRAIGSSSCRNDISHQSIIFSGREQRPLRIICPLVASIKAQIHLREQEVFYDWAGPPPPPMELAATHTATTTPAARCLLAVFHRVNPQITETQGHQTLPLNSSYVNAISFFTACAKHTQMHWKMTHRALTASCSNNTVSFLNTSVPIYCAHWFLFLSIPTQLYNLYHWSFGSFHKFEKQLFIK